MINSNYYQKLLDKYQVTRDCHKTATLTTGILLDNYTMKNVHFNFSKVNHAFDKVVSRLYKKAANIIFKNYSDFPPLKVNDMVKRIGGTGREIFIIQQIDSNVIYLTNTKDDSLKISVRHEGLLKKYLPIKQNATERTLSKYKNYFAAINDFGFLPTFFSKKIVLIATKTTWDNLNKKDCIPSVYLPNTKEENQTTIKSIPALEDCIVYVTPKYEVCYEQILKKRQTVDTIIVCKTDENAISQIIQDQSTYKFKLVVLTNDYEPQRFAGLTLWNWKKEEIELIEQL